MDLSKRIETGTLLAYGLLLICAGGFMKIFPDVSDVADLSCLDAANLKSRKSHCMKWWLTNCRNVVKMLG